MLALHGAGRLGQKNGKGYYKYCPEIERATTIRRPSNILQATARAARHTAARARAPREIVERCVYPLINEGIRILEEGVACAPAMWMWCGARATAFRAIAADRCSMPTPSDSRPCYDGMLKYRDLFGPMHWQPAPLLARLVSEGRTLESGQEPMQGKGLTMNIKDLIAIDVHTHAEVSCRQPVDEVWKEYEDAASKYFKAGKRPTIAETIAYYRERKIGLVMFTVDSEPRSAPAHSQRGSRDAARDNSDIMLAFASIDPHKGKMGVREARRLIKEGGIKGFKFHPTVQGFFPNDRMAYGCTRSSPSTSCRRFSTAGTQGIGTGMPGGGGVRLKYSNPIHLDDVAADFPDMTIIIAHPSWPWQDEALSVCLHKPNVYIDLSGWSPKYFPPQLVHYANTQLKRKMLFGSDYPLITPDRWIKDFQAKRASSPKFTSLILKEPGRRWLCRRRPEQTLFRKSW
jgi:predicted TIM-barrel fold metal-dependent hydrolase